MLKTPSSRSEFRGFPEYYEEEIAPYLRSKEAARKETVTNFFIIIGSLGALALAVMAFGPFGEANLQAGVFVGIGASAVGVWLLNRTRDDITHGLLERICSKLGFSYKLKLDRPEYYKRFKSLGLLPSHNREAWEDEVGGSHENASFSMCEAHLKYKSSGKNSSTRTVFHGQLMVLDYPKSFMGTTVIKRDRGVLNRFTKPGSEFQRVGLASGEFEKAFEAWSTDQVEARDLLDPVVLERFQELERLFGGKALRAAFDGGEILIAIETGDRLNMGTLFKPLESRARVETILKEFDVIFDLIDVLVARVDRPTGGQFSVEHVRREAG